MSAALGVWGRKRQLCQKSPEPWQTILGGVTSWESAKRWRHAEVVHNSPTTAEASGVLSLARCGDDGSGVHDATAAVVALADSAAALPPACSGPQISFLPGLPEDVVPHMLSFLPIRELTEVVTSVCRSAGQAVADDALWRRLCVRDFAASETTGMAAATMGGGGDLVNWRSVYLHQKRCRELYPSESSQVRNAFLEMEAAEAAACGGVQTPPILPASDSGSHRGKVECLTAHVEVADSKPRKREARHRNASLAGDGLSDAKSSTAAGSVSDTQIHDCVASGCSFKVLAVPWQHVYVCQSTGARHFCGSLCDRALLQPSDHGMGGDTCFAVCPISGQIIGERAIWRPSGTQNGQDEEMEEDDPPGDFLESTYSRRCPLRP